MKGFQYLSIQLFTFSLSYPLQEVTSHTLIGLLSQLGPERLLYVCWLVGRLVGRLAGWLVGRSVGQSVGWLVLLSGSSMSLALLPTCWGRCDREPDSKQQEHKGRLHPQLISSSAPALCAHLHSASWGGCDNQKNKHFRFWKTCSTAPPSVLSNLQPPTLLHSPNCFLTRPQPGNPDCPGKKTSSYTRLNKKN